MVEAVQARPSYFPRLASQTQAAQTHADGDADADVPQTDRTARDTVQIGAGAQKQINLGRGAELARELPDASDRAAFNAALESAQADVRRITELFGAVLGDLGGYATAADTADQSRDTAEIDAGGETIVNLSEIRDLARRVEAGELSPGDFAEVLRNAIRDVGRITGLFTETVKQSFSHDHRV